MKFSNSKEFKAAFSEALCNKLSKLRKNKELDEYEFLDIYLQVAECKKIRLGNKREIFLFPDYDKQIYKPDIDMLFKQISMLTNECNTQPIIHLYKELQVLSVLSSHPNIEEADFAPNHQIHTNLGVIHTRTGKRLKNNIDGVFTATHQIDKISFSDAHQDIEMLFESIANHDLEVLQELYVVAYLTLIGYGHEHITFITGKNSYNKQAFLLLLRALASKESSEKVAFRDLSIDDNLYAIGNLSSLYYNPELPKNAKFATTAKELFTNVVKNRPILITRKYLSPVLFYHRGMNVHCTEFMPDGFLEMQDLSENAWEVNIAHDTADASRKKVAELVSEFRVSEEEQLLDHPAFTRHLISTVLYAINDKFKINFCYMNSVLQEGTHSAKEARIKRAKQLAKEVIEGLE